MSDLNESGRKLSVDVKCLLDKVQDLNWVRDNVPRRLSVLRQRIITFIHSTTRYRRTAATHLLVFMISNEQRDRKPYALPVQCIPYKGLPDAKVCVYSYCMDIINLYLNYKMHVTLDLIIILLFVFMHARFEIWPM